MNSEEWENKYFKLEERYNKLEAEHSQLKEDYEEMSNNFYKFKITKGEQLTKDEKVDILSNLLGIKDNEEWNYGIFLLKLSNNELDLLMDRFRELEKEIKKREEK